jgi:hypothetical protein
MAEQTFELYIGSATGTQIDNAAAKVAAMEETLSGTAGTIPSSAAVKNYVDGKSVDTESTLSGNASKIPSSKAVKDAIDAATLETDSTLSESTTKVPTSKAVSDALGSVSSFSIDFTNYGTARYINTDTQLINKVKLINTGEVKLWENGVDILTIPSQEESDSGTIYTYTLPSAHTISAGTKVWWTIERDADNATERLLSIY